MNEIIKQLYERKSVRVFTEQEIDETKVQEILTSAVMAPTAGNMQLYTILRIFDPEILEKLSVLCDNQPFIAKGKLVLLFLADYQKWYDAFRLAGCEARAPGEGDLILAIDDAVIAAQNAVVAAQSYGIGSCYIGDVMENKEELCKLLNLPAYVFPAALLVFGYPTRQQEERPKPARSMAHMVHENKYQILDADALKEQLSGKTGGKDYEEWIRAFCKRKYDSDFSIEMTRSVQEYLKQWRSSKMIIKAVKFRKDGFYTQPMVFGGEEGPEKFDINVRYRGSLQNYLIDTGDEVILVDTGLPAGTPEEVPDETSILFTGKDICSYMEAFAALGYKPEQVTKILLTHKHGDHSGELRSFPNAKIYVGAEEVGADELQGLENIEAVQFTDGAYYNFPESQKICDGVTFIKAKGHTNGNSLVIVENDGLFYMFEGDVTYVDEALYENKLSVVYDDLPAARETLDRVREFVKNHPTVYCGTHTPQGYENLEAKRVMDLDNPVETVLAEVDFAAQEASGKYVCSICGYVYDPAEHDGVAFEDLPDDWVCPRCKQGKEKFNKA